MQFWNMKIWAKLILVMSTTMTSVSALAQDNLFEEIPPSEDMGELTLNEQGVLHRHVRLKTDLATAIFKNGEAMERLTFDLMPGRTVIFRNSMYDKNMGGRTTVWSGRAEGLEDGSVTLVYRRGRILGHVQLGAETFRITPGPDDVHTISLLDLSGLPNEGDDAIEVPQNKP